MMQRERKIHGSKDTPALQWDFWHSHTAHQYGRWRTGSLGWRTSCGRPEWAGQCCSGHTWWINHRKHAKTSGLHATGGKVCNPEVWQTFVTCLMKKLHQNSLISSSFCPGRSLIQHECTHWWMRDFTHCKTMKEVTKAKQQRQLGWISLTDNYVWIKPPNLINEGCSIHRTFCVLVTWFQEMSLRWGGRGQHFIKMLAVLCFLCAFVSLANGTPSPTTHS